MDRKQEGRYFMYRNQRVFLYNTFTYPFFINYSKQSCKTCSVMIYSFSVLLICSHHNYCLNFEKCFHFCIYHLCVNLRTAYTMFYLTLNFCCSFKKNEVMGIAFSKNPYDSNTPLKMGDTKVQSNSMFPIKSLPPSDITA